MTIDRDYPNIRVDWVALRQWAEEGFPPTETSAGPRIPFVRELSADDRRRLRADLLTVLTEPDYTGEPLDVRELLEILREFGQIAGWEGPLWAEPVPEAPEYHLDVAARELKGLSAAPPAVQRVVEELFEGPLLRKPTALAGETTQRVKKIPERDLWQVYLPDGFRLRYIVDQAERTVYVVYLGPHSDSRNDGREAAVRQEIHRRWLDRRRGDEIVL